MRYINFTRPQRLLDLNQYCGKSTEWFMITDRIAGTITINHVVSASHQLDGSVLNNHGIHMLSEDLGLIPKRKPDKRLPFL